MRVPGVRLITIRSIMAVGFAVTPIAMLFAADEKLCTPVQGQEPQKPKDSAKLQSGTEERLRWGKPVNGLRSVLVIRPLSDEPKAVDTPDLFLVVQNVSDAPIHFCDTTAAPKLRELYIKDDGRIQAGIVDKEPTLLDVVLRPREVVFLLMFSRDSKRLDGRTTGSFVAEDALKDKHQSMIADLRIEQAKAGSWTGKLISGETSGAAALGKP